MANPLSKANLLSYLQVDPRNEVIQICYEVEGLRRSRKYHQAIEKVEAVLALSQGASRAFAVTLLYASVARLSSGIPKQLRQAARECERAITFLSANPFDHSIAQIIGAQIDLLFEDSVHRQLALKKLSRAAENLFIEKQRARHSSLISLISTLYDNVKLQIRSVMSLSVQEPQRPSLRAVKPASAARLSLPELKLPIRLRWVDEPVSEKVIYQFIPDGASPEYIDARYVMIDGQLYIPKSANPQSTEERLRLAREGHKYFVLQMHGEPNYYVLIDQKDRPDQAKQMVAVCDEVKREIWLDESDFPPPFDHVHILGAAREWDIPPATGTYSSVHIVGGNLPILGTLESILVPLPTPYYFQNADFSGSKLAGINLADADLAGANLSGANLTDSILTNARLARANLKKTIFRRARLNGADLTDVDLDEAICDDADLSNACLDGGGMYLTSFANAVLNDAQIQDAGMWGSNLSRTRAISIDLRGTSIEGCNLIDADLTSARLEKARLTGANLSGARLSKAKFYATDLDKVSIDSKTQLDPDVYRLWCVNAQVPVPMTAVQGSLVGGIFREKELSGYDLTQTDLSDTDLTLANLRGSILMGISLEEANLEGVDLTRARLQRARLNSCFFGKAILEFADLSDADLSNAYLQGLDLSKTRLVGADLSRANLMGAHISDHQLKSVRSLLGTIMPDGTIYS